jgi:hypothetical protein
MGCGHAWRTKVDRVNMDKQSASENIVGEQGGWAGPTTLCRGTAVWDESIRRKGKAALSKARSLLTGCDGCWMKKCFRSVLPASAETKHRGGNYYRATSV